MSVFAADLAKEGSYDYTTCFTRNVTYMEYSPTQNAWSYNERGTAVSSPQGGLFDGDEIQCVGMAASLDGDVIASNMAMAPERRQQVDFSHPIYNAPTEAVVVLANDTNAYRTLADFKDLPVGATKGSIQLALLQKAGGFS